MQTLALTFQGPFCFSIKRDKFLIHAPICENHRVVISTVDNEYPLRGRARSGGGYTYALDIQGARPNGGKIEYWKHDHGDGILDAPADAQVDSKHAKLSISVPLPETVYSTNMATPEVVKGDLPSSGPGNWATGLTLYYPCDLSKSIFLKMPEGDTEDFSPNSFSRVIGYYDIDIRHSGSEAEDAEHSDAIACFDQTMKAVGLPWWLSYGQDKHHPGGKGRAEARQGADCRSPVIVLGR